MHTLLLLYVLYETPTNVLGPVQAICSDVPKNLNGVEKPQLNRKTLFGKGGTLAPHVGYAVKSMIMFSTFCWGFIIFSVLAANAVLLAALSFRK